MGGFPPTRWSAVVAARSGQETERRRGLERIAEAYWRPVYALLRARWGKPAEEARDLAQDFFARLIEDDVLAGFDPEKGRLRTYLRTCLDALVMNHDRDRSRLKRGGGAPPVPLDDVAELALVAPQQAEAFFEAEWVKSLFALSVERLRAECAASGKTHAFDLFERYDVSDDEPRPTYAELAAERGIKTTDVTNHLAFARREMRRIVLETLREMTASEEEFRAEARALLGITPGEGR